MNKITGLVTDFKRFAVHDGDGIRTTVFLKGCPLKCIWCHNPESISTKPELSFFTEKCTLCGACVKACPRGAHAIEKGIHKLDRLKCSACGRCAEVCLAAALKPEGRLMTVDRVMEVVAEDKIFYETGGGGMTLSGGEPTLQPEFTLALLRAAKDRGINTALDTCGFASREVYAGLLPYVDTFLYDIKHITRAGHMRCTARPNEPIIENLKFLSAAGARIEIRIPLVPGYNDDEATLRGIGQLLAGVKITKIRLLAYHAYARSKYSALGIPDTMPDVAHPDRAALEAAAELLRGYGLDVITE